jgi:hypothetical protein
MADFYKAEYNLSSEELDKFALSGQPIGKMGFSYVTHPDVDAFISADYSIRVVNTRGTGNCGTVVLVGKTPRGKKIVREGKISRLISDGCPSEIAVEAASTKYGMESRVWRLATNLLPVVALGVDFSCVDGHKKFECAVNRALGWSSPRWLFSHGCSFYRVLAALAIARAAIK